MTIASAFENIGSLTVLIHDADVGTYVPLMLKRFPNIRVLTAEDAGSLERHVAEADIILGSVGRFPAKLFEKARRLRWFQATGAGVESLLPARDRIGHVVFTNAKGLHGEIIADFVMTGIGMMHWSFPQFIREQLSQQWNPRWFEPIADKTMGVVGLGSIGAAIGRRGKSAGMTVVGMKRDTTHPVDGIDRLLPPDGLDELLQTSDFVVLAVPHVPETTGLIGREQFERMRRGAFLINIARGSVVVERELIAALTEGTIAGAVLDVFEREPLPSDSPLWMMPNVLITPHISGSPTGYAPRVFEIFSDNLQRLIERKPLRNVIDLNRGY